MKRVKVKKIDPEVLKVCKKNKIKSIQEIGFVNDYVITGNATGAYRNNYSPNQKATSLSSNACGKMKKETIRKSIEELLNDHSITKSNVIEFHRELRDKAKKETVSLEANRDFMKMLGMLDKTSEQPGTNIYVGSGGQVDFANIDKLLQIQPDKP